MRMILLVLVTLLVILPYMGNFSLMFVALASNSAGWLSGWKYRMALVIDYPVAVNHPVQVEIVLTSSNFTGWVDLRSDGSDIRFTLDDGITEIPYYLEKFDYAAKYAKIVVKVPYLPITIYMYWGNAIAVSKSNPDNVFIFYDDFSLYRLPSIGPSLPIAIGGSDATVLPNGTILVIGGFNPNTSSPLNTVYKFNGTGWELVSLMPTSLWGMEAVTLPNGSILVFGGNNGTNEVYEYYKYDPLANTWTVLGTMPMNATVVQGIMAVYNPDNGWVHIISQDNHYIYIPDNNTWIQRSGPPAPRRWGTLVYHNGKLYLLGGYDDTIASGTATVYIYDVATDVWSLGSSAPVSFYSSARGNVLYKDIVIIPGGVFNNVSDSRILVYNITADRWYWVLFDMNYARNSFSAVMVNGTLYVIGGSDSSGSVAYVELIHVDSVVRSVSKWSSNHVNYIVGDIVSGWYEIYDATKSLRDYWIYDPTDTGSQHRAINVTSLPMNFTVEFAVKIVDDDAAEMGQVGVAIVTANNTIIVYPHVEDAQGTIIDPSLSIIGESLPSNYPSDWVRYPSTSASYNYGIRKPITSGTIHYFKMVYKGLESIVEIYNETMKICDVAVSSVPVGISITVGAFGGYPFIAGSGIQYIKVASYLHPSPTIIIGAVESIGEIVLPANTMLLSHIIVYSPNSTQFSHSFTATNITTAGYETNYTTPYGWRVYAYPYQSSGISYENTATLVSSINITLPYTSVIVENVTLYARTNGTGSFRQLWIKVIDSTGQIVAELMNATIASSWTTIVMTVNASLSGQLTIWINATVLSTTTAGEEISIKNVAVSLRYDGYVPVRVPWIPNKDFNCTATFIVDLGSTDIINTSIITFKLIEYLTYSTVDYPVIPVYVGNETIDGYIYNIYMIEPANYSQVLKVYAILENEIKTIETRVDDYITDVVLVDEQLNITVNNLGNITIRGAGVEYVNVTSVLVEFDVPGTYIIEVNRTLTNTWKLGYATKTIIVKYGGFTVNLVDIDANIVNYEDVVVRLINENGLIVKDVVGRGQIELTNLPAGNYALLVLYRDIIVALTRFELNITTDSTIVNAKITMKRLVNDYRGLNKTVACDYAKTILDIENLSTDYPFSRIKVLLNGTGEFVLIVNYVGDLPSGVSVVGNVSGLSYYWDGSYLVVSGVLGSVGEIVISDLYRLRVEAYDRLGNVMPGWMYVTVNGTRYDGSIVEAFLYPADYVLSMPQSINGFVFYGFWDGFNETSRVVSINNTDVVVRVWYRVPTRIANLTSYRVETPAAPFLLLQNGMTAIYVEGYLVDYYGNGVPGRPVTVTIVNPETGYSVTLNATTDPTGYFRTPIVTLLGNVTYTVTVSYQGDDIYVGTIGSIQVTPEQAPLAPQPIPVEYYIAAAAAVAIAAGIVWAIRGMKHSIAGERRYRFVKRG